MRWVVQQPERASVEALCAEAGLTPLMARLLAARGIATAADADRFFHPTSDDLYDPLLLPDIEPAIDRLRQASRRRERVMLFGDYDVDGISAVAIYVELCGHLGMEPLVRLPHRLSEGYGLSDAAIDDAVAAGVTLLITADCGTTAIREIARARSSGIDVIVTDHHQVPRELPAAVATMNPWRDDATYPFRGLCSAGLAWKLASAVALQPWGEGVRAHLESWTDLAALGTIADVMPLKQENRYLVAAGLRRLTQGVRPGIRALKRVAGIEDKPVGVGTVGFILAPRLNAAGRLGDARASVDLLTTIDPGEAARLAEHLQRENMARRQIEGEVLQQALALAGPQSEEPAIVVAGRGWHPGVIGIVASRLVDRFYRPAVVIALDEASGVGKGSGRTIAGVDLYQAFSDAASHLRQFGGHRMAAGLTIDAGRVESFRKAFQHAVGEQTTPESYEPELRIDAELALADCSWVFWEELRGLAPFGPGNPEPVFVARGLELSGMQRVGKGHLRLTLASGPDSAGDRRGTVMEAMAFGQADRMGALLSVLAGRGGKPAIDAAFVLRENRWQGESKLQLHVKDVAPADRRPASAGLAVEPTGAVEP